MAHSTFSFSKHTENLFFGEKQTPLFNPPSSEFRLDIASKTSLATLGKVAHLPADGCQGMGFSELWKSTSASWNFHVPYGLKMSNPAGFENDDFGMILAEG